MECLLAYSNVVTVPHKMVRLERCQIREVSFYCEHVHTYILALCYVCDVCIAVYEAFLCSTFVHVHVWVHVGKSGQLDCVSRKLGLQHTTITSHLDHVTLGKSLHFGS